MNTILPVFSEKHSGNRKWTRQEVADLHGAELYDAYQESANTAQFEVSFDTFLLLFNDLINGSKGAMWHAGP